MVSSSALFINILVIGFSSGRGRALSPGTRPGSSWERGREEKPAKGIYRHQFLVRRRLRQEGVGHRLYLAGSFTVLGCISFGTYALLGIQKMYETATNSQLFQHCSSFRSFMFLLSTYLPNTICCTNTPIKTELQQYVLYCTKIYR